MHTATDFQCYFTIYKIIIMLYNTVTLHIIFFLLGRVANTFVSCMYTIHWITVLNFKLHIPQCKFYPLCTCICDRNLIELSPPILFCSPLVDS